MPILTWLPHFMNDGDLYWILVWRRGNASQWLVATDREVEVKVWQ